ncbi:MAG: hypothetical protein R2713_13790 [Ilumatobacteraceae bacterium]
MGPAFAAVAFETGLTDDPACRTPARWCTPARSGGALGRPDPGRHPVKDAGQGDRAHRTSRRTRRSPATSHRFAPRLDRGEVASGGRRRGWILDVT